MATGKIQEADFTFPLGAQGSLDPTQLPAGYYARGMNVVNRGGVIQCRPGYECLTAFPEGLLQGFTIFRPKIGMPVFFIAVAGVVYICDFPFRDYRVLSGVSFSAMSRQVFFKQVEQSVIQNDDGSITILENPKNLLVMQDGGSSPAVVFDGTTATAQRGVGLIPIGSVMEWVGDRLWVARDSRLFASDLGNPLSFVESQYVSGAGSLVFPDIITALSRNPALETGQLFVFTNSTTSLVQAGVRSRASWSNTPDFQKEIFQVGCVSSRSVCAHHGFLRWFSRFGLTSIDSAAQANVTSVLPYDDDAMNDSKALLSDDLSGVACASFENYFLASVPHADRYNKHTWVLDSAPLKIGASEPAAWNSYWTGTRPVEWASDIINGQNRIFYVSADFDGINRLWEAFTPNRLDEKCPITWWAETRGLNARLPGKTKNFRYAEIFCSELSGVVDIAVFWAGSYRGKYKRILTKRIQANTEYFAPERQIDATTDQILGFKKQSRPLRTQDGKAIIENELNSSCDVEAPAEEFKDEAFQLLIVGSGPGAIRGYITYVEPPVNEDDSGRCEEDETTDKFVRFDGAASEAGNFSDALSELSGSETIPIFTATKVEAVSQDGFTEIGTGSATSIISQADADKIATAIARRIASHNLEDILPKIVSQGEAANE